MRKASRDERILVLAPVGQDASAIAGLLTSRGLTTQICRDPAECGAYVRATVGALIATEEALECNRVDLLLDALRAQPSWSELPLIILTTGRHSRVARLLDIASAVAHTITLLERPIQGIVLLRSADVALRSRRRQYQVRDLLTLQRRVARELRQAHVQLRGHANELETLVRARTAELTASNHQLQHEIARREQAEVAREALRRQLLNAEEHERGRISRELHDQMGQNLTALNLGLQSLHDGDPRCAGCFEARLRPLRELAATTAKDLHRVAVELRPSELDDLGLVDAVRNLVTTWSTRYQTSVAVNVERYDATRVSAEFELALYRIIQEAFSNIAKHAGASQANLVLSATADCAQAIIEDDGCGFEVDRALQASVAGSRLGLRGIHERLDLIGGVLTVESAPGRGCTVVARIPLPASP